MTFFEKQVRKISHSERQTYRNRAGSVGTCYLQLNGPLSKVPLKFIDVQEKVGSFHKTDLFKQR